MLCSICGKKVKTKKTILNLFDDEIHHLCESCYMLHPLCPKSHVIPIDDGVIYHNSMIKGDSQVPGIAFMSFVKPYLAHYLTQYRDCIFLYLDDIKEISFITLDSLKLGNIYLLTLYENIEEGEKL